MNPPLQRVRSWLLPLRRTPLHPQWLLGSQAGTASWVGQHAQGRVLDIGCADRWIVPHLRADSQYLALDYPATGGVLYGAKPDVFGDAGRLPFPDASIDTVLLLEVLEHLRHPEAALPEIARVLKPGGVLLMTLPFLYPVHDAPHDYQRYTAHGLQRELQAAGLAASECSPTLGSVESAGLLFSLALGGTAGEAIRRRSYAILLLPLLTVVIPLVNIASWLLGRLLPPWPALTAGYRVLAVRP
ncbi:methyltransferase domain-containing protein [Luteimonas sp. MC1750]|uniref:class I SAM-dependent methyltransferase n=1 Tax=Luteimonas sp. MC1750 TaxID=2799326 RepID=UPI0018F0F909|nr:methyltransferase domain-containing protein [Luteimonas sp. MC1750]MBJ6985298.1 methyltransferase domain-containing protein [Luteimonas sp. MC1750]QQO05437.1 methyltransferase domain-containing protein [Luteimonas sp. MC1750]